MLQQPSILLEWNKLQRKGTMHQDGHTTSKRKTKKRLWEGLQDLRMQGESKDHDRNELQTKTKTTKHNSKAKKFKKRRVVNKHHHMRAAIQK